MRGDAKRFYPSRDVVLIADTLSVYENSDEPAHMRQDLEMTDEKRFRRFSRRFPNSG